MAGGIVDSGQRIVSQHGRCGLMEKSSLPRRLCVKTFILLGWKKATIDFEKQCITG